MTRVHVICEGQTEETFVRDVLVETHFCVRGIDLRPSLIGKSGGNFSFERLLIDIRNRLLGDPQAWCTTFFDFYGLPERFPGKKESSAKRSMDEKANCLLSEMTARLQKELGKEKDAMRRFIPYVQMHEFEGLLFSSPKGLAIGINQLLLEENFQDIRKAFNTPEWINDNLATAPSKRIQKFYKGYQKPLHGPLAAIEIGLDTIRKECKRFDAWLNNIESLSPSCK